MVLPEAQVVVTVSMAQVALAGHLPVAEPAGQVAVGARKEVLMASQAAQALEELQEVQVEQVVTQALVVRVQLVPEAMVHPGMTGQMESLEQGDQVEL